MPSAFREMLPIRIKVSRSSFVDHFKNVPFSFVKLEVITISVCLCIQCQYLFPLGGERGGEGGPAQALEISGYMNISASCLLWVIFVLYDF
jgi:hypothetical protein